MDKLSERARERGLVSRNPSHMEARALRTASTRIKLCFGRIPGPFTNPRVERATKDRSSEEICIQEYLFSYYIPLDSLPCTKFHRR